MDKYEALEILYNEEIKMLLDYMSVSSFCKLCNIHRSYYYKIIDSMSRYEIYKKYCG